MCGQTAEDVAEFNMLSLFHELPLGERYSLPKQDDKTDDPKTAESKKAKPKLEGRQSKG